MISFPTNLVRKFRVGRLNLETFNIQRHDLSDLDQDISEEEIHAAVMQMTPEKSPGSDGFTHVILLEKRDNTPTIGDYRPISIMHSIVKLLTKILANRLAPRLDHFT
jgi:hypothetical protein